VRKRARRVPRKEEQDSQLCLWDTGGNINASRESESFLVLFFKKEQEDFF
jgi:hypothetical protein